MQLNAKLNCITLTAATSILSYQQLKAHSILILIGKTSNQNQNDLFD